LECRLSLFFLFHPSVRGAQPRPNESLRALHMAFAVGVSLTLDTQDSPSHVFVLLQELPTASFTIIRPLSSPDVTFNPPSPERERLFLRQFRCYVSPPDIPGNKLLLVSALIELPKIDGKLVFFTVADVPFVWRSGLFPHTDPPPWTPICLLAPLLSEVPLMVPRISLLGKRPCALFFLPKPFPRKRIPQAFFCCGKTPKFNTKGYTLGPRNLSLFPSFPPLFQSSTLALPWVVRTNF